MTAQTPSRHRFLPGAALLELLNPREHTALVAATLAAALLLAGVAMRWLGWPLWAAAAAVLALMLVPGVVKWRADMRRYGWVVGLLGLLVAAQGLHGIEHLVQWTQNHVLNLTPRQSNGVLSPANAEWVHFIWNWTVLLLLLLLAYGGMRNIWFALLLAWAAAHTFEHSYMFVRYLDVLAQLREMGISSITAQGLPGVLGRDGWLARSAVTQGTFFCRLPAVTTATRLDVHFWWNAGETILLLLAANTYLQRHWARRAQADRV